MLWALPIISPALVPSHKTLVMHTEHPALCTNRHWQVYLARALVSDAGSTPNTLGELYKIQMWGSKSRALKDFKEDL